MALEATEAARVGDALRERISHALATVAIADPRARLASFALYVLLVSAVIFWGVAHLASVDRLVRGARADMASLRDVRRLALALPDTSEGTSYGNVAWAVHGKTFAWERPLGPKDVAVLGADAPSGPILGIRTDDLEMKAALLASDPRVFFTTPHFDGYPTVLIRLAKISTKRLETMLVDALARSRTPKRAAAAYLRSLV